MRTDLRHVMDNRRKTLALTFLILALLSGKFSVERLFPTLVAPEFLLQFRTIFLALAAICSIGMRLPEGRALNDARLWWLTAAIALCLLHALVLPGGPGSIGYATDFIFLMLMLAGLPLLVEDAEDRRWGALVTVGVSLLMAIYMLAFTHLGDAQGPAAINLTVLRLSFFGLAACIYLLATQRNGHFWICLVVVIIGFTILDTTLKAAVVMIVTMGLSIIAVGLASRSVRRSSFYWPLMLALTLGFVIGLSQNYAVLQLRTSDALVWNQPSAADAQSTREWVARTLAFYDVAPNTPAATAWPGIIKPFSCIAVVDETRMTAEQFVDAEVPDAAWKCIFVDKTIRLRLYLEALGQFIASPLLGTGFGSYVVNTREFDFHTYTYPHNVPLELLGSAGLIVFLVFSCAVISAFWAACRSLPTHQASAAAVIFLPTMVAASLFAGDIYDFRFYFVAALLFVPWSKRPGATPEPALT